MIKLTKWRNYLLAFSALSINSTALHVLSSSTAGNNTVAEFKFPQEINLTSGKMIAIAQKTKIPLKEQNPAETIQASQKYQFRVKDSPINLEMTYLVSTRGDVSAYLQNYTAIPAKAIRAQKIKQIEQVGDHTLITTDDRLYLSSCISPRSLSNVTQAQFSSYRYQNDLQWKIFWSWLTGKSSIRDRRCLWVHLSTPLVADLATTPQTLETVWQEIYRWWLPNFPPL